MGVATNMLRDKDIYIKVAREVMANEFGFDTEKCDNFEEQFETRLANHMLALIRKYEAEIDEQGSHKGNRSACEAL